MATATQRKPVYSTRSGRNDAAVWEQESQRRTFYNVSLKRNYMDGDEWKHTQISLGEDDVLAAANHLEWAYDTVSDARYEEQKFRGDGKPFASKRRGQLEIQVWQKDGSDVVYRVCLSRHYTDNDEQKKSSVWLPFSGCLPAAQLLRRSFDAIDSIRRDGNSDYASAADQTVSGSGGPPDEDIPF